LIRASINQKYVQGQVDAGWTRKINHKPLQEGITYCKMPIQIIAQFVDGGLSSIPYAIPILKTIPLIAVLVLLKIYFGGARNTSERLMHSKVVMVTV
jgi:hypothetical protein